MLGLAARAYAAACWLLIWKDLPCKAAAMVTAVRFHNRRCYNTCADRYLHPCLGAHAGKHIWRCWLSTLAAVWCQHPAVCHGDAAQAPTTVLPAASGRRIAGWAAHLPDDVRHARLVAHEGRQVGRLARVIAREGFGLALPATGALLRQEAQRPMARVCSTAGTDEGGRRRIQARGPAMPEQMLGEALM